MHMDLKLHKKRFAVILCSLAVAVFLFTSCASSIGEQMQMKVSISPAQISVGPKNGFKQKAMISWEITNSSKEAIDGKKYALFLGEGRVNDASSTLYTEIKTSVAPGTTEKGTYEKVFEAVLGATGDYEVRFWLNEKIDETRAYQLKQATAPFHWEVK